MFESGYTVFKGIHKYFADFIVSLSGDLSEDEKYLLWLACGLLSYSVEKGHICIDLIDFAGKEFYLDPDEPSVLIKCPQLDIWINLLKKLELIGTSEAVKPLILRDNRFLYLNRYWQYERTFIEKILQRINTRFFKTIEPSTEQIINRLFPDTDVDEENMQKKAAINGIKNNFLVISGGPGTGKTFTIAKLIALLIQTNPDNMSIALATPTGKAAARLKAMIRDIKEGLDFPERVKAIMPEEVWTIHRLLGSSYRTKRFYFNEYNPLPYDFVIVDEASMVDLPLMSKLLEAIKDSARLILVGDKDQLSSVEPGSVFGDICEAIKDTDAIVFLKKNYRFGKDSGIGELSELIKQGSGFEALELLKEKRFENIKWRELDSVEHLNEMMEKYVLERYASYLNATDIEEAFIHFDKFHVLCGLRHGPYGVIAVNGLLEKILTEKKIIKLTGKWYRGKPVMITSNNYQLKLFNGDIGIVFEDPEGKEKMKVFFKTEDGGLRKIAPARINDYETAYAITVHKSQGSEFDHIVFILSDTPSEIFTRELIYTAITRAKKSIEIWGTEHVFIEAVKRKIKRTSGIRDTLLSIYKTTSF